MEHDSIVLAASVSIRIVQAAAVTPSGSGRWTYATTLAAPAAWSPCGHKSHGLLHTTYTARGKYIESPAPE